MGRRPAGTPPDKKICSFIQRHCCHWTAQLFVSIPYHLLAMTVSSMLPPKPSTAQLLAHVLYLQPMPMWPQAFSGHSFFCHGFT